MDDDPAQSARALFAGLTDDAPGFVARETLIELYWVLRRAYRFDIGPICDEIEGLAAARVMGIETAEDVLSALPQARAGADFPDLMIAAAGRRAGCSATLTFDRRAAQAQAMRLIA